MKGEQTLKEFKPPKTPSYKDDEQTAKLKKNEFGDGYDQYIADGLRPWKTTTRVYWPFLEKEEFKTITAFFKETAGAVFLWNIDGTAHRYRCIRLSSHYEYKHDLTVELEEVTPWNI